MNKKFLIIYAIIIFTILIYILFLAPDTLFLKNSEGYKELLKEQTEKIKYDDIDTIKQRLLNGTYEYDYSLIHNNIHYICSGEVTNEGEISGYANEIIDYMPKDLVFSSEMNKAWYKNTNGTISNKELANTIINPGETKTVSLTLTKKMTQNNTGTTINIAEIGKSSNDYKVNDKDSIAKNKNEKEDDIGKAELIISLKTGETITYILIIFTIIAIIGVGVYFIKKKIL